MTTLDGKPLLRGHFHQSAFFFALGACAVLLEQAHSLRVFFPGLIYAASLVGMFGISALYHRPRWNPQMKALMKRIDHAAIFVLIAATGTPICLLAMSQPSGDHLLALLWIMAAVGASRCIIWVDSARWISVLLYIFIGWISVTYIGELHSSLGARFWFLVVGGAIYSAGALVYALKRPNPWPSHLGFHEIFHLA